MELTEHAQKFLVQEALEGQEGDPSQLVYTLFDWIARVAAEKDHQIEPEADLDQIQQKFRSLMLSRRFFPSFELIKFFGQRKGIMKDMPLDHLGGYSLARSSLSNSEVISLLHGADPYLIDVPSSFLRVLDKKEGWPISYQHEPFVSGKVSSVQLWGALADQIMNTGYPVMHFPESVRPETQITNPPGQMVRGVLNLAEMVGVREGKAYLDRGKLVETLVQGVRMLDALVDIAESQVGDGYLKTARRIGVGLMGWGELLLRLEIPYACEEALEYARRLIKFIQATVREATSAMVQYRPAVEGASVRIRGYEEPVRNLSRLYVLPEPELAFIAGTSAGIGPLPGLAGRYHGFLKEKSILIVNPLVVSILQARNLVAEGVVDQLLDEGVLDDESNLPENILELFNTVTDISPFQMLEHQLAFQDFCDDIVVQRIQINKTFPKEDLYNCFRIALRRRARTLWISPTDRMGKFRYTQGSSTGA